MSRCQTEFYSLAVPDDWSDRSMITWVAPQQAGGKVLPNLLCSKGEKQAGEDLDGFVNRQLKELMGKVKNFELISRHNTTFGGLPAVELNFAMRPQGIMLQQRQVFFSAGPDDRIIHTVVVTAAREDFPRMEPLFQQMLSSVSWNS